MEEAPPSPAPPRQPSSGCLKWLSITFITTAAIGGFVALKTCSTTATGVKSVAAILSSLPAKFSATQITETFRERLTSITPTHGDILEVAVAEREETLTKSDMKTTLFNTLYLGTTTSEIRVPAVYRYHVKLSEEWKLGSRGSTCVVIAPRIRVSDPPAVRTDKMETNSKAGWMRFNSTANLSSLQKNITPMLSQRAGNSTHIDEVREASRKAVGEFVKNWLVSEDQWKQKGFTDIVIVFADEPAAKTLQEAATQKPAIIVLP
ncbi:MAG: hypothetical protein JWO94_2998 [Verrucomicrobiaceae bacterium]|nr:hypothetical protein [Verrucomicrobiaceae bacterium]